MGSTWMSFKQLSMSAVYFWSTVKVVLFEISSQAGKSYNCEQGGRRHRCWQPGHSSEQQGGVLATSSTEHQDSKGIWETIP